jgi:hypothetical protein|tara:strand:+ start:280 stop:435 length:156 start_codon:yes stop_codon:yes gene_type:complete
MKQEIICNEGVCKEFDNEKTIHFEDMFSGEEIVDKLKKDQWLYNMYGVKTN